ncbi:MAG: hypothetical protein AAFX54_11690 [Pseudomonadota bacterium]
MHICILETDEPPAPLDGGFGGDPTMLERFLPRLALDSSFSSVTIRTGQPASAIDSLDALSVARSPTADSLPTRLGGIPEEFANPGLQNYGTCFNHVFLANQVFNSFKTDE